jgi:hypothetical protein
MIFFPAIFFALFQEKTNSRPERKKQLSALLLTSVVSYTLPDELTRDVSPDN